MKKQKAILVMLLLLTAVIIYGCGEEKKTETPTEPVVKKGSLVISSEPSGAKISIDGVEKGATPTTVSELDVGQHELQIIKDDYYDVKETIIIAEGENPPLSKTLLKKGYGILKVASSPEASVSVDGEEKGKAPLEVTLEEGEHNVSVGMEGYLTHKQSIVIAGRQTSEITANLVEISGTGSISVVAPTDAKVYVDDELKGTITKGALKIANVPAGRHTIKVTKEGYKDYSKDKIVEADKELSLIVSLSK